MQEIGIDEYSPKETEQRLCAILKDAAKGPSLPLKGISKKNGGLTP